MKSQKSRILKLFSTVCTFLILALGTLLIVTESYAGEMDTIIDSSISEKARKRLYPGGRDEEDLRVQNQLVEPRPKYHESTINSEVVRSMSGQPEEAEEGSD